MWVLILLPKELEELFTFLKFRQKNNTIQDLPSINNLHKTKTA